MCPTHLTGWVTLVVAMAVTASLQAQHDTGPKTGFDPAANRFVDVKGPRLSDSDTASTEWGIHIDDGSGIATGGVPNYAGFLFDLQYDGGEVSDLSLAPLGIHAVFELPGAAGGLEPAPTFQGSNGQSIIVQPIAIWIQTFDAQASGLFQQNSQYLPLMSVQYHAKNTTPANNSDLDIKISQLGIIRHATGVGQVVQLHASDWIYAVSPNSDAAPAQFGQGTWVHLVNDQVFTLPPSGFYATAGNLGLAAAYGIEHVPEPASLGLLAAGAVAVAIGRVRRRSA